MFINNSYSNTQELLNKALKAETLRFSVISNNIANADTPGFKRSGVAFESHLKRAIKDARNFPFSAKKTNNKHLSFENFKNIDDIKPKVVTEYNSILRNDKNNVDVEKEMVDAAKSNLRFQAFSSFLSRNYRLFKMLTR